jgi:hypothetical protein
MSPDLAAAMIAHTATETGRCVDSLSNRRLDFSARPLTESHCVTDYMRRRGVEAYNTWFNSADQHFENCCADIFMAMLKAAAE